MLPNDGFVKIIEFYRDSPLIDSDGASIYLSEKLQMLKHSISFMIATAITTQYNQPYFFSYAHTDIKNYAQTYFKLMSLLI